MAENLASENSDLLEIRNVQPWGVEGENGARVSGNPSLLVTCLGLLRRWVPTAIRISGDKSVIRNKVRVRNLIEHLVGNRREGFLGVCCDDGVEREGVGVLGMVKSVVGSG
ncbi:hypothetical protein F3Y22_tig00110548pilonHSYRG00402 [Hibiscus syriacus]|uniref:Uncharacterized protein n=1 Tax=Hibiscus syriacus TaxID=106335 RepID=A0A6A3A9P7_HIBSY|nr:hypothetical protein F3Y22_tig00110548pilonHSYRG00402 [Hibiscus syriacus]